MERIDHIVELDGIYRHTATPHQDGWAVWTERLDRRPMCAGVSLFIEAVTYPFESPKLALEAARAKIASGELK